MARFPKIYVDKIVAFAGSIYVEGWRHPDENIREIFFAKANGGERVTLPILGSGHIDRPDVARALQLAASDLAPIGFILRLSAESLDLFGAAPAAPEWTFVTDNVKIKTTARVKTIGRLGETLDTYAAETIRRAIEYGLVDAAAAALFGAFDSLGSAYPPLPCHIDNVGRTENMIGIDMWVENARTRDLAAITDDGLHFLHLSDIFFTLRRDVTEHLRQNGSRIATDSHGVFLPIVGPASDVKAVFLADCGNGALVGMHRIAATPTISTETIIGRMLAILGGGGLPEPQAAEKYLRPLFAADNAKPAGRRRVISTGSEKPEVSIVVPIFKEFYFLRSLLAMQMAFGGFAEWIFVCDDPELHGDVQRLLSGHSGFCRARTILILNDENYGYSTANAIGVAAASCDAILFMNSDIWIDEPSPIRAAIARLRSGEFGVVGFRLLYEDGTVQHDGMTFAKRSELHGLYAIDHPGKGLPPLDGQRQVVPAVAVTGALLMTRRDVLDAVGGFSREYIRGDFEDADLCLKAARAGHRVGLLQDSGIYHLERQSIRKMAGIDYRQGVTYLNCIHFNEVWGRDLEKLSRPAVNPLTRRSVQ